LTKAYKTLLCAYIQFSKNELLLNQRFSK
jgi:hypothetical protein